MLKCEIHGDDSYIETSGSLLEIIGDVIDVIRSCYRGSIVANEEAGEAFKNAVQMIVAYDDSPAWEWEEDKQEDAFDGISDICIRLPKKFQGGSEEQ